MEFRDGLFAPSLESGSAAEKVASLLGTRVAGAFHTVPAGRLLEVDRELDYDVLVTAETKEVYAETAEIVSSIRQAAPALCRTAPELEDGRGHYAHPPQRGEAQQDEVPLD